MKDMNTDKLAINWQNLARVRLQLKFAFIIGLKGILKCLNILFYKDNFIRTRGSFLLKF